MLRFTNPSIGAALQAFSACERRRLAICTAMPEKSVMRNHPRTIVSAACHSRINTQAKLGFNRITEREALSRIIRQQFSGNVFQ